GHGFTLKKMSAATSSLDSTEKADGRPKHLRAVPDAQPKPKRERFRHTHTSKRSRHAEKAKRLADLLREQRRLFPGFAARIDQFIAQIESDAHRTRKSDREKVLDCLRTWSEGLRV